MAGTSIAKPHAGDVPESIHGELDPSQPPLPVRYNPDAPSEEWGWHGSFRAFAPKGSRLMLWIGVIIMFAMLIGNHVSRVENYYLIGTGILLAVWLLRTEVSIRKDRRRKP